MPPTLAQQLQAKAEDQRAHERRVDRLLEAGWTLEPEGWVLDTSDARWSRTSCKLVPYAEGVAFEDGTRSAYSIQKDLEAKELRRLQQGGK